MANAVPGAEPVGTVWHMALKDAPAPLEPLVPAAFGPLGLEAQVALATAMGLADATEVRRRFDGGRRCYAAWAQGALAAYGWVSFEDEDVGGLGLHLRFRPGEAYIWDCATAPAFRRHGLYSALLGHMVEALRAEGQRQVWIGADYENWPSQAGIARAGFTAVVDIVASPVLPGQRRRRAWLQARPAIGEGLVAEVRRVFMGDCQEVWLPGVGA